MVPGLAARRAADPALTRYRVQQQRRRCRGTGRARRRARPARPRWCSRRAASPCLRSAGSRSSTCRGRRSGGSAAPGARTRTTTRAPGGGSSRSAASTASASGRPLSLAVNSEPPSSIIRNIGTQTALELDDADAQVGMAFERAVQDEVGARERGRASRGTPSRASSTNASGGSVYHASSNGRRWSATWNSGRHAVLDERAPDRVVVGMRERPAVDERGRDHREPHAVALEPRELGAQPLARRAT